MYKPLLFVGFWAVAQPCWGQSCAFSNAAGQTQSIHDVNCIELGDNFSSTSEIDITVTPTLGSVGQWTAALWGFYPPTASANRLFIGIHTHVLPNGEVLSWQGHNDNQYSSPGATHPGTDMYRWNPGTNQLIQLIFHVDWTNAFCTGHTFLADGRLLVTGGHDQNVGANGNTPGYALGLNHVNTYDYAANQFATRPGVVSSTPEPAPWVRAGYMTHRRWYPTNTTLQNQDVLITAGETEPSIADDQKYPELWQNGTLVTLDGAPKGLPNYPWMFQAYNGKVFYAGPATTSVT